MCVEWDMKLFAIIVGAILTAALIMVLVLAASQSFYRDNSSDADLRGDGITDSR